MDEKLLQLSQPNEQWREIIGYEGRYWVSDMGRILSKINSVYKIKKQQIVKGGYLGVTLCLNYKTKSFLVHRLVASHFIGQYDEKRNATNHKNSIRTDNRSCNLEICDYAYNNQYAYDYGHKKPIKMFGSSNKSSQIVVQLNLYGKYVAEFSSKQEASDKIGLHGSLRVYRIGNKLCSNNGFIFMLKDEYLKIKNNDGSIDLPKFRISKTDKRRSIIRTKELIKVVQLDDFGNPIQIFDDYKTAQNRIGKKGILDVCRKRKYTDKKGNTHQYLKCGGFKWMYYDDFLKQNKKQVSTII